ncbi:hypothetical protein [Micromonospora andamanensis]|uniref:hypothetical protein n=1 Tax=Micromonospora andamanensis TaxID=1287068 RepID=UPI001A5AD3F3|nr:hypothetical protein [Micromonospora andamanensis]GIJ37817.1 hypothetical protein Vwe01_11420 [Micromonospora andamanensis]
MCGLVDGERFLYGDPLLDLVSPLLFRGAEDEPRHPFLRGYAAERIDPKPGSTMDTPPKPGGPPSVASMG